jgi:hypothetical protein
MSRNRVAYELLIVAGLMLGSCMKYPPPKVNAVDMARTAEANARQALTECNEHERRISAMEHRMSESQSQVRATSNRTAYTYPVSRLDPSSNRYRVRHS